MKEFCFTVTKTGYVNVEADSFEDAEAILKENLGSFMFQLMVVKNPLMVGNLPMKWSYYNDTDRIRTHLQCI